MIKNVASVIFGVLFLSGCAHFAKHEPLGITQRVILKDENSSKFELATFDSWESAYLKDDKGDAFSLLKKPSKTDICLANKNNISICLKDKVAILKNQNKEIKLKVTDHMWLD